MSVWVLTILFLSSCDSQPRSPIEVGSFETLESCREDGERAIGSDWGRDTVSFMCSKGGE